MPIKRVGKNLYEKKGGKWKLHSEHTSVKSAAFIKAKIEGKIKSKKKKR